MSFLKPLSSIYFAEFTAFFFVCLAVCRSRFVSSPSVQPFPIDSHQGLGDVLPDDFFCEQAGRRTAAAFATSAEIADG